MEKPTIEQRNQIYKKAYQNMRGNFMCGCEALFSQIVDSREYLLSPYYSKMRVYFPEYNLFKPSNVSYKQRWFNGTNEIKEREIALLLCIEMTS